MTVDNRVAALRLVQKELCDAALFDPSGMMSAVQGSAKLRGCIGDSICALLICPFAYTSNDDLLRPCQRTNQCSTNAVAEGKAFGMEMSIPILHMS